MMRYLFNRREHELPLICIPVTLLSRRRMERALDQLDRWYLWAAAEAD